jgi:hypothetical protein
MLTKEAADKLASQVRAAFMQGADAVGVDCAIKEGGRIEVGNAGWRTSAALAGNLRVLAGRVNTWQVVRRAWAERGSNDDGDKYTWTNWADDAKWYRDELRLLTKVSLNDTPFEAFKLSTQATVSEVGRVAATVAQPLKWPTSWKVGAAVVGLVVVLAVATPVLAPLVRRATS